MSASGFSLILELSDLSSLLIVHKYSGLGHGIDTAIYKVHDYCPRCNIMTPILCLSLPTSYMTTT